jgi:hypothetical protein
MNGFMVLRKTRKLKKNKKKKEAEVKGVKAKAEGRRKIAAEAETAADQEVVACRRFYRIPPSRMKGNNRSLNKSKKSKKGFPV